MTSEQMAWGLVSVMAAALGALLWREITAKDKLWKKVEENKRLHDDALAVARREFTDALNQVVNRFTMAIDSLNATNGILSQTIERLDVTIAKEYATKIDLREAREDFRREIDKCADNCPPTCGR